MSIDSVGTRYKGNSTFCLPNDEGNVKVPYNMDFNYWNEDGDLLGFHKIKLANAWLDPTFAKEYLGAQIYQRYLPSPCCHRHQHKGQRILYHPSLLQWIR